MNIDYELVGFSEIDKWAITSYCAIHNVDESLNLGDVSKIKDVPDCDCITHGSPCTSYSVAGKGKGGDKGSGTESSLMWYTVSIVTEKKPKYVIWENVKGILTKNHKHNFELYLNDLENLGYNNYWKVLNAKDFNIPQNRERVYVISIRKDIDNNFFTFPAPLPDKGIRLKNLLENKVDEKYYINNERTEELLEKLKSKEISNSIRVGGRGSIDRHQWDLIAEPTIVASRGRYTENKTEQQLEPNKEGVSNALTSVQKDNLVLEPNKLQFVGGIDSKNWIGGDKKLSRNYPQGNRVYSTDGIACNQTTNGGGLGGTTGLYLEKTNKLQLFTNLSGGKWDKMKDSLRRVYDEKGICPTISTCQGGHREPKVQSQYRIRKLTPLECWRLMGFEDKDYWVARKALEETYYNGRDRSNSQMYKMAGNSIVVNVLEGIFNNLLRVE